MNFGFPILRKRNKSTTKGCELPSESTFVVGPTAPRVAPRSLRGETHGLWHFKGVPAGQGGGDVFHEHEMHLVGQLLRDSNG